MARNQPWHLSPLCASSPQMVTNVSAGSTGVRGDLIELIGLNNSGDGAEPGKKGGARGKGWSHRRGVEPGTRGGARKEGWPGEGVGPWVNQACRQGCSRLLPLLPCLLRCHSCADSHRVPPGEGGSTQAPRETVWP